MWLAIAAMLLVQAAEDDLERGRKALEENHVAEAVPFLEKAAATAPDDYAAHFHLALAYSLLKRDDAALAEYQKALKLKPGLYQAEMNEAILLTRKGSYADALPLLRDAQQQKPKEFRPSFYLGEVLLKSGQAAAAVDAYQAALANDPQSAPAEVGLGRALLKSGKLEEAAPHPIEGISVRGLRGRDVNGISIFVTEKMNGTIDLKVDGVHAPGNHGAVFVDDAEGEN